jgi:hypothetical protein
MEASDTAAFEGVITEIEAIETDAESAASAADEVASPRQHGRKSAGARALRLVPDVMLAPPKAPARLSADERAIWRGVVERFRPGFFYSCEPLLEAYCRLVNDERTLAAAMAAEERGSKEWAVLMRLKLSTVMATATLAVKLRVSNSSTSVDRRSPKLSLAAAGPRPWEDDLLEPEPET